MTAIDRHRFGFTFALRPIAADIGGFAAKADAEEMKKKLEAAGAKVELK